MKSIIELKRKTPRCTIYFSQEINIFLKEYKNLFSDKELSLSFSIPTESYAHNVQPPNESVYQQVTPKIMSRQTSLSILSASTPPPLSGSSRGSQIFTLYKTQ